MTSPRDIICEVFYTRYRQSYNFLSSLREGMRLPEIYFGITTEVLPPKHLRAEFLYNRMMRPGTILDMRAFEDASEGDAVYAGSAYYAKCLEEVNFIVDVDGSAHGTPLMPSMDEALRSININRGLYKHA